MLVYTVSTEAKNAAVEAVTEALADGALSVGDEAGFPLLLRFVLGDTGDAPRSRPAWSAKFSST